MIGRIVPFRDIEEEISKEKTRGKSVINRGTSKKMLTFSVIFFPSFTFCFFSVWVVDEPEE